jgi:hypothetical protein
MLKLSRIGVEGVALSGHDYLEELNFFGERVLPLMRQAGLRTDAVASKLSTNRAGNRNVGWQIADGRSSIFLNSGSTAKAGPCPAIPRSLRVLYPVGPS